MKLLMIAYYFPPDSSSGAFRPLYLSNYFRSRGDQVDVLTARRSDFLPEQTCDDALVPEDLSIHATRVLRPREWLISLKQRLRGQRPVSMGGELVSGGGNRGADIKGRFQRAKDWVTTLLACPDPHVGWLVSAVSGGRQLIRERRVEVIYATGGPWTGMIAGALLKMGTRRPLVVDFRDPWTRNPPFALRPKTIRWLESWMERFVISKSDLIVANTEALAADFKARYPKAAHRVVTLPNGYVGEPIAHGAGEPPSERFDLTHAGSLYFSRNPKNLVKAMKALSHEGRIHRDNFRLNLVGGISIEDPELTVLLKDPDVHPLIHTTPRLPLAEAVSYQMKSQVQLLIQVNFPLQVPRKLYDAMPMGTPVLAITESDGATSQVIERADMGMVVENRVESIKAGLEILLEKWESGALGEYTFQGIEAYSNDALCRKMRGYIEQLLKEG